MRILALGDPHGTLLKGFKSILKKNKPELIIITGEHPDVPFFPKKGESEKTRSLRFIRHYESIFEKLNALKLPIVVLRGNEAGIEGDKLFKMYNKIIHKTTGKIVFKKNVFVLFDMFWEKDVLRGTTPFIRKKMRTNKTREKKLNQLLKENLGSILISHAPPYGYFDMAQNEFTDYKRKHVGSKILLNAIKKHQPKLVLCGHIH